MNSNFINEIKRVQKSLIKEDINNRLSEFESFSSKDIKSWFSELCFCILTANSKAKTAIEIQQELGPDGFCECEKDEVKNCIIKNKHRFHNNKSKYIVEARKYIDIKSIIEDIINEEGEIEAREWIVKHIKGIGYKEASHFLRNVGYKNYAILDRHILNLMYENGYIYEIPKTLSKKRYLDIESKFKTIADELSMSAAELDLYMWYLKTGEVLK